MTTTEPDRDVITSEIHIAAPPERVFQALVDPEQVVKWWGGQGEEQSFRCTHFECDLRPGGKWRSVGVDAEARPFEVAGEVLEVNPPRLLVYTWVASWSAQVKTTVRWELEPTDRGTLLRHQHSGLRAHPDLARSFRGWPRMLGWLQSFVERGETASGRNS